VNDRTVVAMPPPGHHRAEELLGATTLRVDDPRRFVVVLAQQVQERPVRHRETVGRCQERGAVDVRDAEFAKTRPFVPAGRDRVPVLGEDRVLVEPVIAQAGTHRRDVDVTLLHG
jgi:hypothetical protein